MSKFVALYDGTPSVSHTVIAQNTDNEASSVKRLIDNHLSDFEEFGVLGFEIVKPLNAELGGRPSKIYYLNEPQATLLLTYLQNTTIVREFKKALVKEFYQMRGSFAIANEKFTEVLTALSQKSSEADEYKNKYYATLERENLLLRQKMQSATNHNRWLNDNERVEILRLYKEGLSQAQICRVVGRSENAVKKVIRGAL